MRVLFVFFKIIFKKTRPPLVLNFSILAEVDGLEVAAHRALLLAAVCLVPLAQLPLPVIPPALGDAALQHGARVAHPGAYLHRGSAQLKRRKIVPHVTFVVPNVVVVVVGEAQLPSVVAPPALDPPLDPIGTVPRMLNTGGP